MTTVILGPVFGSTAAAAMAAAIGSAVMPNISTEAFLINVEKLELVPSASRACCDSGASSHGYPGTAAIDI